MFNKTFITGMPLPKREMIYSELKVKGSAVEEILEDLATYPDKMERVNLLEKDSNGISLFINHDFIIHK